MKPKPRRQVRYSAELVSRICEAIKEDSYTVAELARKFGMSEGSYYEWLKSKPEFLKAIKDAEFEFTSKTLVECNKSLKKLINGFEYEEIKTTVIDDGKGKPKIKEKTTIKKHVAPNLGAIIHYQTNKAPEEWQNKQRTEVTGKDGEALNATPPVFIFKNLNEE